MAGRNDERDLFLEALRIIREAEPRAILLENVKGLLQPKFDGYRLEILSELQRLGYDAEWQVLDASDFGVPQTRRRSILVGFREGLMHRFVWPLPHSNYVGNPWTITAALYDMVAARGWKGVEEWAELADCTASTIVGGSSLKRGADLGQPHSAEAWAKKGINPRKIANDPPGPDDKDLYLTNRMLARLQDFPHDWKFSGPKQAVFRQIANAFPPVVALFLGCAIRSALTGTYIDPRNTLRLYNRSVFRLKKPDAPLAAEQIAMSKPVVRSRPSNTSFVPLQKLRRHSYLQEQDDSD
jgi:DNA (cytosine-5)-methyltransferase 1